MKNYINRRLGLAVCVLACALTVSGCTDKENGKAAEDIMQQDVSKGGSEKTSISDNNEKKSASKKEKTEEKENSNSSGNSSLQEDSALNGNSGNNVSVEGKRGTYEYTSADGKIVIVLPDTSWRCIADGDGMLSFASDAGAIDVLNLGSADLENSVMAETQEAFESELNAAGKTGYQVLSFQYEDKDSTRSCKSVIQYPQDADFNYEITFTFIANGQGYEVKGLLKTVDQALVEMVKNGIFDITVQ